MNTALKKYKVRFYYQTHADVYVKAYCEEQARNIAEDLVATDDFDDELLTNLQESSDPSISEEDED